MIAKNPQLNPRERLVDDSGLLTANSQRVFRQIIPSFADSVTPTGTIDGANKVFTLPSAPFPIASLKLRKRAAAATSWTPMALTTGFTISGNVITYAVAPSAGDVHECDFRYLSPP